MSGGANIALQQALSFALEDDDERDEWDEKIEVLPNPNLTDGRAAKDAKDAADGDEGENYMDIDKKAEGKEYFPVERPSEKEILAAMEAAVDDDDADTGMTLGDMTLRARYIPLRLTYEERKHLRRVNAALNVSDYTTSVDIPFKSATKRDRARLQNICAFLTGIVATTDLEKGTALLENRNLDEHELLIRECLEIARRYKFNNPEKMRSEYGKLVYLMQDAMSTRLQPLLALKVNEPVQTVHDVLNRAGALDVLSDPLIHAATREILDDKSKSRAQIQAQIRKKEDARRKICNNQGYHRHGRIDRDIIEQCLYSIGDNESFLNSNRLPIDRCIELLKHFFHPTRIEDGYSLAIDEGRDGSRLSHSHELQFNYVLQSLTLWRNIIDDLYRLWFLAEQDLLSADHPYSLRNTGQGLQRVQESPKVFRAMQEILQHTKQELGGWVGSSMIHLGDHNVPNTLVFIDKYTQVAKILGPLIHVIQQLQFTVQQSDGLKRYIAAYGGIDKALKDILHDFFRSGFDGSGGDNDFDAGSCIDGRLTSAWHWCSTLATKPYYPLFRLTGFLSFDGEFDK